MKKAKLEVNGKVIELDILDGTCGPSVIDIQKLYAHAGVLTYDPGFMSTAACSSKITYIDGDAGILRYRGYGVADLAMNNSFTEVAHLLLYGNLPNEDEMRKFEYNLNHHSLIHEQMHFMFRGFPRASHPMSVMVAAVAALSAFYNDSLDISCPEQRDLAAHRVIAKISTLAAMTYRYSIGWPFVYPKNNLSYCENFLYMMFSLPTEEYIVNPVFARTLNKLFILHADHEQNASTSTVRIAGSSGANPFACIASGVASLWGPLHGGANEAVLNMLDAIGDVKNIPAFIARVKNKEVKLMGFGHRVYKNYDPRATILKESCNEVLAELGEKDNKRIEIAMELERIALNDAYFVERKLYPNVDFYSGIIYEALGIPVKMFTVMFAVARAVGWISHWKEMIEDPLNKINRPRQLYLGETALENEPTSLWAGGI